jgi:hypothetical protein
MAVLAVGIAAGCGVAYAVGYRGSFGTTAQLEQAVRIAGPWIGDAEP